MAISEPLTLTVWSGLTYSPEGIPASLSARPESEAESKTRGIFGPSSRASFAYFDPDMCCWRTSQATFLSGLDQFSETWPDSGTMRNGCAYGLQISERPTCESACSSWRTLRSTSGGGNRSAYEDAPYRPAIAQLASNWNTPHGMSNRDSTGKVGGCGGGEFGKQANQWVTPQAHQGGANSKREDRGSGGPDLKEQTERWQTPATDSFRSRGGDRSDEMGLDQQARFWPTASARDWKSGDASQETMERNARPLNEIVEHWPTPDQRDHHPESMTAGLRRINESKGGAGLNTMAVCHGSPQALPIPAGQPSSPNAPTSRRRLNPQFVEWLLGFPIGWTELD